MSTAKFKLNLKTREVEIEGSEDFVERQIKNLETMFELIGGDAGDGEAGESANGAGEADGSDPKTASPPKNGALPAVFGEYLHSFSADISDIDKALVTARFVQAQSQTNDFKTSEVNRALIEHGIKLANPSLSLKRLAEKKHMFQTRKVGKLRYMRVSTDGQAHLETIKVKAS